MFHRGLQDFDSLTDEERPRFLHTAMGFLKVFENIYLHVLEGSVGAEVWIQNRELLYTYSKMPGLRYYLSTRSGAFDQRFLDELRSISTPEVLAPDIVAKGPGKKG